jgi:hypothetical protein
MEVVSEKKEAKHHGRRSNEVIFEHFPWIGFFFLGAVSIVSSSIGMSVLLQIVWQESPIFIL